MINKEKLISDIEELGASLREVSSFLHQNPELGGEEILASAKIREYMSGHGFNIQDQVAGLSTAFIASKGNRGPHIAYLAEYDALPQLGHACGHNLIAVSSMAAAIALALQVDTCRVSLFGTPSEETDGGKIKMLQCGLFDDVDVAMMVHPGDSYMTHFPSLALDAFRFTFHGKPAHAAGSPQEGLNALDAVILMFNGIGMLRQQLPDSTRVHGIISEGGVAPNIIPERTSAEIYVRSQSRGSLVDISQRVKKCAYGAAEMTGTRVVVEEYEAANDDMINNPILERLFGENLSMLGINNIKPPGRPTGSSDIGNVSHCVPAIQPFVAICHEGVAAHTRDFAKAANSESGFSGAMIGAKALAMVGADLINDKRNLTSVRDAFNACKAEQHIRID